MKHIVIIDDSQYKRESIKGYMKKIFPQADIEEFTCVNPALYFICREVEQEIKNNPNDWLIITDMQMPMYMDVFPDKTAGLRVLRELNRKGFECPAILQSSDALEFEEYKDYYEHLLGTVEESIMVYNLTAYLELLEDYT